MLNWCLFYPIEKYLSAYTDTLITINQEDYQIAKKKFKRCKDIEYIPGVGIDEEKFNFEMTEKEKTELRKSLGLNKKDFVIIFPAEISKRKRQIWLINSLKDTLKKYNDIHLILPGKDSLDGKCQRLVKKLNLEKQVHFLGYRKDIPKLLKISNLAVSSSKQEGLLVNLMEAMYVGLPIVATDCRGNRDLIKNKVNGILISLKDKKEFASAVEDFYLNINDNYIYSANCKKAIKEYLLDKVMKKMSNIYNIGEENEYK